MSCGATVAARTNQLLGQSVIIVQVLHHLIVSRHGILTSPLAGAVRAGALSADKRKQGDGRHAAVLHGQDPVAGRVHDLCMLSGQYRGLDGMVWRPVGRRIGHEGGVGGRRAARSGAAWSGSRNGQVAWPVYAVRALFVLMFGIEGGV